jgi:glycolate oxidase iron-sulfur subunit
MLPHRDRFAQSIALGRIASPFEGLARALGARRLVALMRLAKTNRPSAVKIESSPATAPRKGKVILQAGCAEPVLRPAYQAAAARLLSRSGYDVARAPKEGCCGALVHHLGREEEALAMVRRNVDAWSAAIEGVDAIIVTASGCNTLIKDYGFLLRNDRAYAAKAARISDLAQDISEFLTPDALTGLAGGKNLRVAWQAPCSLQHGQRVMAKPKLLLERAGFEIVIPMDAHLCCGSAGTYSILQPEIADRLGDRKAATLEALKPDVIATANVGCALHLSGRTKIPLVHVVELLDWATGGPRPAALG